MRYLFEERELFTIGAVLEMLQEEFPDADITISKIRFLESAGLVTPVRTPTGYRKFSPADVDRLRYTLRAQRDQFLPLRVIRERLDSMPEPPAGLEVAAPSSVAVPVVVAAPEITRDRPTAELSADELATASGLSVRAVVELERIGLIKRGASGDTFTADAAEIAGTVAALGEYGLDTRHLGPIKSAAEKQVDLVERFLSTRLASSQDGATALYAEASEIAKLNLRLESLLIDARLESALANPST